jgi:dephospho-CoA kinase
VTGAGLSVVGVLNDDSSSVGRRHFAVICKYDVGLGPEWSSPERGENSITKLRWIDIDTDDLRLERFEYWSQLCLRTYYPEAVRQRPAYIIRRRKPLRPPHVLCVLGQIGSGKTQATAVLKSDFGYVEVNSGQALAALLQRPALTPEKELEREEFQREANAFIRTPDGPTQLAGAIWDEARRHDSERVVVDGIRQRQTLDALADVAVDRPIGRLYVHTPADVAFDFYRRRRRVRTTIDDFIAVREAEVESDVEELIGEADAVLYNAAGLRSFRALVRRLMAELGVPRRRPRPI